MTTPRQAGFRVPPEWAPHASTWIAWPSHADLWQGHLPGAQAAIAQMASAIVGDCRAPSETVNVLVPGDAAERAAKIALPPSGVRIHRQRFGDIWLRDTAPLFLLGPGGKLGAARFAFNGWGGKYVLEHDDTVGPAIAGFAGAVPFVSSFVLEGGAVDFDGEGTVLTTRQCMLNPNRNGAVSEAAVVAVLSDTLAAEKVLWFDEGLQNDHTDGHVDTLLRFVRPGVVVAMEPTESDDPNKDVLRDLLRQASAMTDARGRRLEVVVIPSPGRVADEEGRAMPASYANFYISNRAVIVPTYAVRSDERAVERIGSLFPGRQTVGIDARAVLSGGGAFHCVTQQEPKAIG